MSPIAVTDSHCHPDRFDDMTGVLGRAREASVDVFFITLLPSGFQRYRERDFGPGVRLGLGFHPMASRGEFPWRSAIDIDRELELFADLGPSAEWIGEIGLDFSPEGAPFRGVQERVLDTILAVPGVTDKFLSIHSRFAPRECVDALGAAGATRVVMHGNGFTGDVDDARYVIDAGFHLSLVVSNFFDKRGRAIAEYVPPDRVLIETDGPFGTIDGRSAEPHEVGMSLQPLAEIWGKSQEEVAVQLDANLKALIS
jgi:TatD DNase family protein